MKRILLSFFVAILNIQNIWAQTPEITPDFLFGDENSDISIYNSTQDINNAKNQAKNLLMQSPKKLPTIKIPSQKKQQKIKTANTFSIEKLSEAPFGMFWGASQAETRSQGVILTPITIKDYDNSFSATSLPKPLEFFNRISVVFGKDDELYRILSYSKPITDNPSAQKTLDEYNKYSNLLEKKYGNKQVFFTPATIKKTIKNQKNQDEVVEEEAPLGNPDFLNQLLSGDAVLYSTYHNQNVAAALSISVDGEKKSYIVIDYKNLKVIKKQEDTTLDAL
jgi:hypothetical protein